MKSWNALPTSKILVTRGIVADDSSPDTMAALTALFENLQLCSTEAAWPDEDLFNFSERCTFFGLILRRPSFFDSKWKRIEGSQENNDDDEEGSAQASSSRPMYESEAGLHFQVRPELCLQQLSDGRTVTVVNSHPTTGPPIGLVYLMTTQTVPYPLDCMGEQTLGIILSEEHRGKGYAKEALELVLEEAFSNMHCHRVQVNLLNTYTKDRAMMLFTHMRFGHEGTRRRAFFSLIENEWKDTTTLALLNTDWIMRASFKAAPKTLWDEMLARHTSEREQLLRWEERQFPWPKWLKRTSSMETIRVSALDMASDDSKGGETTDGSSSEVESMSDLELQKSYRKGKGKRPASLHSDDDSDPFDSDSEFFDLSPPPQKSRKVEQEQDHYRPFSDAESEPGNPFKFEDADIDLNNLQFWNGSQDSWALNDAADAPSPSPSPAPSMSSSESIGGRSRSRSWSVSGSLPPESEAGSDNGDGYNSSGSLDSQWDLMPTRIGENDHDVHSSASESSFDGLSDVGDAT